MHLVYYWYLLLVDSRVEAAMACCKRITRENTRTQDKLIFRQSVCKVRQP